MGEEEGGGSTAKFGPLPSFLSPCPPAHPGRPAGRPGRPPRCCWPPLAIPAPCRGRRRGGRRRWAGQRRPGPRARRRHWERRVRAGGRSGPPAPALEGWSEGWSVRQGWLGRATVWAGGRGGRGATPSRRTDPPSPRRPLSPAPSLSLPPLSLLSLPAAQPAKAARRAGDDMVRLGSKAGSGRVVGVCSVLVPSSKECKKRGEREPEGECSALSEEDEWQTFTCSIPFFSPPAAPPPPPAHPLAPGPEHSQTPAVLSRAVRERSCVCVHARKRRLSTKRREEGGARADRAARARGPGPEFRPASRPPLQPGSPRERLHPRLTMARSPILLALVLLALACLAACG